MHELFVSLKSTMSPEQNSIHIIHNCEKHFFELLRSYLVERGIVLDHQENLSDVLAHYERALDTIKQHLKPLQRWNKTKDECYALSLKLNGNAEKDEYLIDLMEKTAFEGQILWLTLQED